MLSRYAETLNLLGDETRLRLCALLRDRELRVTDLVRITGVSQSRVSTHLGRLKEAGCVKDRREGSRSFYALTPQGMSSAAKAVLDELVESSDPVVEGDKVRALELEAERRGDSTDPLADDIERDYSPGRSWHSLALGLAAGLRLGKVLDIGCGDGSAAACIAPHCQALTCVDTDASLVDLAKTRLARFSNATASIADAQQLPFEPESFDVVMLFHTLTYAESPTRLLREAGRVLRRGGRLLLLCLDRHEHQEVTQRYRERHPGFSPQQVRSLLSEAQLDVLQADVACRENRKPHLQVILAVAQRPVA